MKYSDIFGEGKIARGVINDTNAKIDDAGAYIRQGAPQHVLEREFDSETIKTAMAEQGRCSAD